MLDKEFEIWKNDINNDLLSRHAVLLKGFMPDEELIFFIDTLLSCEKSKIPRKIINTVERLVTLADDIEKIRPKDSLKIFFIVVCIESLYKLSDIKLYEDKVNPKNEVIIDFFKNYLFETDKRYILDNFGLLETGPKDDIELITIESFALLVNEIRNNFAHEGIYWEFSFAPRPDTSIINNFYSPIKKGVKKSEYTFDISMIYSDFRDICIRGFINFIKQYFERINKS